MDGAGQININMKRQKHNNVSAVFLNSQRKWHFRIYNVHISLCSHYFNLQMFLC